jgi:hypothetical protein
MTKEKITTVFLADTTIDIKNVVEPVSTTQSISKIFKSEMNAYRHDNDMKNAILVWNDRDEFKPTNYDEEITHALKKNNDEVKYNVKRYVETPVTTIREVKIADLTVEQKIEFEKLNDVKIVEETFPKKVVEFKTASKFYAVANDNSIEAVNVQLSICNFGCTT